MKRQRGNLDDVMPPAELGSRPSHFFVLEFAFWAVVALLWLAFEGGVVGLLVTAGIALFAGLAWRDLARRAKNPIQAKRPSDE
jgi:hypothetical protein